MNASVSNEELYQSLNFWRAHHTRLADEGTPPKLLEEIPLTSERIGFGQGQIRPGELGQFDVFYASEPYHSLQDRLLISGLSEDKVKETEREQEMKDFGWDPDNPEDVKEYEYFNSMTRPEAEAQLVVLEKLLKE